MFDCSTFMFNISSATRMITPNPYLDMVKTRNILQKARMKHSITLTLCYIRFTPLIEASIGIPTLSQPESIFTMLITRAMTLFLTGPLKLYNHRRI